MERSDVIGSLAGRSQTEFQSGLAGSGLQICWPAPPPQWPVENRGIDIWAADLRQTDRRIAAFAATLSADEQARAARFRFDEDQNRFIVGRGLLRTVLARYVGGLPAALVFSYGAKGKPSLAATPPIKPLFFNLAHSGGLMLLAISRVCEVGVDVERIVDREDAESIAGSHFAHCESAGLRELPVSQRSSAFHRLWTRKEACLKATGEGITEHLSRVEVSFLPDEPARLGRLFGSAEAASHWTLCDLVPSSGFIGALAAPVNKIGIKCWRWQQ